MKAFKSSLFQNNLPRFNLPQGTNYNYLSIAGLLQLSNLDMTVLQFFFVPSAYCLRAWAIWYANPLSSKYFCKHLGYGVIIRQQLGRDACLRGGGECTSLKQLNATYTDVWGFGPRKMSAQTTQTKTKQKNKVQICAWEMQLYDTTDHKGFGVMSGKAFSGFPQMGSLVVTSYLLPVCWLKLPSGVQKPLPRPHFAVLDYNLTCRTWVTRGASDWVG